MDIFIPSRGRATRQTTLTSLPDSIRKRCTLVIPKDEFQQYSATTEVYGCKMANPDLDGIGAVRQWCCDRSKDKVLMLDDDLVFATRRTDDPTKFRDATDQEIVDLISQVEYNLEFYAHVGVSTREGGNRDTNPEAFNTRLLRMLAYDTTVLRKEGIRFNQIPVMEDFYVGLSLLTKGYGNIKLNHMVHNQGGSNTEGGCSEYRTPEVQAAAAHLLAGYFPDFVTVVYKETKAAWGGGTRTDVRIQWKKAYDSSQ